MVYLSSIEELTATIDISNVRYESKEKKAFIVFTLKVAVKRVISVKTFEIVITADEPSIEDLRSMLEEKQKKLEETLLKVKNPIEKLLKISSYVEVDVGELANQFENEIGGFPAKEKTHSQES